MLVLLRWLYCRNWLELIPHFFWIKSDNKCKASNQKQYHLFYWSHSPAWKLLRPKLVFWKFNIVTQIMGLFVMVIICDLLQVACFACRILVSIFFLVFLLIGSIRLDYIYSGGQNRAFWFPLLRMILAAVFLLLLPSFYRKFQVVRVLQSY